MAVAQNIAARAFGHRRQQCRKAGAKQLATAGINGAAMLFTVAGRLVAVSHLHHLADMNRVVRLGTKPRRMRRGCR